MVGTRFDFLTLGLLLGFLFRFLAMEFAAYYEQTDAFYCAKNAPFQQTYTCWSSRQGQVSRQFWITVAGRPVFYKFFTD
jgi:hypothetical protein